jgi:hypothetical protein
MAYAFRIPTLYPRYSIGNLVEKRRDILRYARSLPPGPQRNQLLQTALSLRSLFKNKGWLDANTLFRVSRLSWQLSNQTCMSPNGTFRT